MANTPHHHYKIFRPKDKHPTIYLSMGCFWTAERHFWGLDSVIFTEVGYINCVNCNPSCEDAFKGKVKHREVVEVMYKKHEDLRLILTTFFSNHTPYWSDDFPVPHLYRSGIYYTERRQIPEINAAIGAYSKTSENEVMTHIKPAEYYVRADDRHQQYNLKKITK